MKLRRLTASAVFCAVVALLAQMIFPLPAGVPITLQTLGVALAGFCLGWKGGLVTTAVYLALGACGLPVFSGFGAGIGWLLGPTGGYLFGFLLLALFCGMKRMGWSFLGLALCHLWGVLQFSLVTENSLWQAFLLGSLPYLLKDAVCVVLAKWLSGRLQRHFFLEKRIFLK